MQRLAAITVVALLLAASSFASDERPVIIQPEEARQRAAQLRLEAHAHQEMELRLAAQTGGSRRDRRWRKTMIGLCRDYAETAFRAAKAYERFSSAESPSSLDDLGQHSSVPVTVAEYDRSATEYEARAKSLRADADRHLSMLRTSREPDLQQPYYGNTAGQRRRGGWLESPKARVAREHCEDVVQQNIELARDAADIAKHYRLRARQLESAQ